MKISYDINKNFTNKDILIKPVDWAADYSARLFFQSQSGNGTADLTRNGVLNVHTVKKQPFYVKKVTYPLYFVTKVTSLFFVKNEVMVKGGVGFSGVGFGGGWSPCSWL